MCIRDSPLSVQSLLAFQIIDFLEKLEEKKSISSKTNITSGDLKFHILDRSLIEKLVKVQ